MAEVWNSCTIWKKKQSQHLPKLCPNKCFEPRDKPCPECKIITGQSETGNSVTFESVVKDVFGPEPPVRRVIDTKTPCSVPRSNYNKPPKSCNLCDAENETHNQNLCYNKCRPLSTSLHLNEYTKRPRPKPVFKHSILLAPDLMVGRVFPVKIRISRLKKNCYDCGKDLYFRDPVTNNNNVVVLDNCCDVKVYSEKYIDNWHRVPVVSITGRQTFKKKTLDEVCKLEPKKIPPPPPPPPEAPFVPKLPEKKAGKGKKKK